jgi:hypothetical protein
MVPRPRDPTFRSSTARQPASAATKIEEIAMTSRTIAARGTHVGSFATALTLAAVIAVMAGAKTAKAWDQQATGEQMNYELSYRALQGANAPRQHTSGAYASANPHPRWSTYRGSPEESFGTSVPYDPEGPGYNDFQMQGR